MDKTNTFSIELQNVITYMIETLGEEYPTELFTPEYLLMSIIDNKKCHANIILNNCVSRYKFMAFKTAYHDIFEKNEHKRANIKKAKPTEDISVIFDDSLIEILNNAENENNFIGSSNKVGTEHVLLSMLSEQTNYKDIKDKLSDIGIDYNFILNRCMSKQIKNSSNEPITPQTNDPITNWVKSKINQKAVSNKSEYIRNYTTNLNDLVRDGKVDELIGRDKEIDMIIKVLARRKKNNVILVGNGGVGKTSIVNGIAQKLVKNDVPPMLQNKEIVTLNVMSLVSGTHFRGMMEERVKGLFDELKTNKNYILFLDDIQQVLKTSTKDKDTDLSSMISDILSEGEVRVIGTTTFKDYRNGIESNTALNRKLQKIVVEPNTVEDSIKILMANKHYYEEYHNVRFSEEVIRRTVELSERYITDRSLPDSAIDVLDLSGAYTCLNNTDSEEIISVKKRLKEISNEKDNYLNNGDFESIDELTIEENTLKKILSDNDREFSNNREKYAVEITIDDIAKSISDMTNIPINKLNTNEKQKIAKIEDILKESIVGQDEAIEGVCRVIKRNKIGLGDKKRVTGALLMIGPSGTGKTLIAKKLAEEIFGSERDLVRIDMSEYSEKNSVAKLTGASPGYIGYENGGQLTEAIKNKQHCVLLLDEIEKADQEVYNLFLQLFDEGRLTDNSGQVVNFKNVIVLMTSNIGAKQASEFSRGSGFISDDGANKRSIIEKQLKKKFTPEFINRIDQIVYFNSLSDENLKSIVSLELKKFNKRLNELNYGVIWDDSVVEKLHSLCLSQKEYGARPIIRLIQDNIEDKITDLLLLNDYSENYSFSVTIKDDKFEII